MARRSIVSFWGAMSKQQEHHEETRIAVIAVGSNATRLSIKSRDIVTASCVHMSDRIGKLYKSSSFYQTPAFPAGSGPDYVNAVVAIRTELSADAILATLHQIEADFGRTRETRWGQRTLDLDLIALGDLVLPDLGTYQTWRDLPPESQMARAPDRLILPHPRVQDRSFVLVPLAEIMPEWRHPVTGKTASDLLAARPADERASVVPV